MLCLLLCHSNKLNILLVSTHAQTVYLLLGEVAPVAAANVLLGQSGKLHAVELGNLISQRLEDAANDAVLARVNLDAYLLLISIAGILDGVGLDVTVLQCDALGNLLHIVSRNSLVQVNVIDFLLQKLGVRQLRSQVAIIGKQQHTGGVAVQTTNGIDTLGTSILNKVHHRLTLLGIIAGGNVVLGFVQQHINFLLQCNGLVVETDVVGAHHLGTQLVDNLTIDSHHTSLDKLVGLATAANTGISQELVQTDGLIGIEVLLLIFNTLLQRILGIGIIARRTLTIAALLRTLSIATTLLTVTAALLVATTLLIAALLTVASALLIATLLRTLSIATALLVTAALLITTLARLVTTLLAVGLLIVTGTITTLFSLTLLVVAGTIAALLTILGTGTIATLLIATLLIIVVTGTIATVLRSALQTCAKALGTEAALVLILITVIATLLSELWTWLVNTWTR